LQELRLIDLPGAKMFAHETRRNQTRNILNSDYSDRLLGPMQLVPRLIRLQALEFQHLANFKLACTEYSFWSCAPFFVQV
jgi:hypothetical protein